MEATVVYRGYKRIMENKINMEPTVVYRGYIGIFLHWLFRQSCYGGEKS